PGQGHAHRASLCVPHGCHVLPIGAAVVHLPGPVHRAAGDTHADGSGVFPAAQPALPAVAAVASRGSDCAVLRDADTAIPAQGAQRAADPDQGCEGVRWRGAAGAVDDSGNAVFNAAGTSAHVVSHSVRHRSVSWLVSAMEVATTCRQRHALGRGPAPPWFADAAGRALDGAGGLARSGVSLVVGAYRGVADSVGAGLGTYQSHRSGFGGVSAQAVP